MVHEDWILKNDGPLTTNGCDHVLERQMKILTHIGQCQRSRAVHASLTVDVDHTLSLSQEPVEHRLEPRIPVEDIDVDAVDRIQTDIVVTEALGEPLGACSVVGAIDDMGNVVLGCKALS